MNYFIIAMIILIAGLTSYFRSENNTYLHAPKKLESAQNKILVKPNTMPPVLEEERKNTPVTQDPPPEINSTNSFPQFTEEEEKYFISIADEERRAYFEKLDNMEHDPEESAEFHQERFPANDEEHPTTIEDIKNEP